MSPLVFAVLALVTCSELGACGAIESGVNGEASAAWAAGAEKPGREPVGSPTQRTRASGEWTIVVPSDFELVDNGDSWQAHKGHRVVYVSALTVKDAHDGKMPGHAICAAAAQKLGKSGERLSFSKKNLRGEAEVIRAGDHWQLKGFLCADGTLAACVIDYPDEREKAWAVSTWRSLEHP